MLVKNDSIINQKKKTVQLANTYGKERGPDSFMQVKSYSDRHNCH